MATCYTPHSLFLLQFKNDKHTSNFHVDTPSNLPSCNLHQISSSQPIPRLMTDEGSAYPIVVTYFGWNHLLERCHFNEQITSSWEGLEKPDIFRKDILLILDSCTETQYTDACQKRKQNTQLERQKIYWKKSRYMTTNSCMLLRQTASLLGTFPLVERKV